MSMTIKGLQKAAFEVAESKGWHDRELDLPRAIALLHSEASEALEELRLGYGALDLYYDSMGKPCGFSVELADLVIRVMELCERLGIDMEEVLARKLEYNRSRSYRHGGKKF